MKILLVKVVLFNKKDKLFLQSQTKEKTIITYSPQLGLFYIARSLEDE